MCRHKSGDDDTSRPVEVIAVETTKRQSGRDEALQKQGPDMRLVRAAAPDHHKIPYLELGRSERLTVDELDDRPQQQVHEHNECGRDRSVRHIAGAGQDADRGGAPQRRRSIEAANIQAVAEDNACPQKANARDYLRGDPGRARLSREERREDNEARGPERYQRVRAY